MPEKSGDKEDPDHMTRLIENPISHPLTEALHIFVTTHDVLCEIQNRFVTGASETSFNPLHTMPIESFNCKDEATIRAKELTKLKYRVSLITAKDDEPNAN